MKIEKFASFVPEIREIFVRRYEILDYLNRKGTVGRRTISNNLKISERIVRFEVEKLKDLELVSVSPLGITINDKGKNNLEFFFAEYRELNSLTSLGEKIKRLLKVEKVVVTRGDISKDESFYTNLASASAEIIDSNLKNGDILGVTGGKTLSIVADQIKEYKKKSNISVIPARGSLGKDVSYQANSIASKMASKLNGQYQMLPVPDSLSKETMDMLLENSEVKEVYEKFKKINILIFGIGRADVMLSRRGINKNISNKILEDKAVAEAFGYYFDLNGKKVYHSQSIGITMEEFLNIPKVIGVAAGAEKAQAIISVSALRSDMILVIDESAANCIINTRR